MTEQSKRILRVLCIHGYRQSGDVFRNKLGALKKILKKHVEFVFITAPHTVIMEQDEPNAEQQFGWWFCLPEKKFNAKMACESSIGLEESLAKVEEVFSTQGPFDGVLGFSQGAALAAMLCSYGRLHPESKINFQFVILVAGFRSICSSHKDYYQLPLLSIPSLHVMGETDQVIEKELSENLAEYFENHDILLHSGGHYVPATSQNKSAYLSFIDKQTCNK